MFDKKHLLQFEKIATPFYYYDLALLNATLLAITSEASLYDFDLHYALKANSNRVLLKAIQAAGLGADCVSGNEVLRALEVGFEANRIVFAGVGKSDAELCIGLSNGIGCFNCESMQELEVLNDLALKLNTVARVALRINPNIRANTHHYITTGLAENKFGIQAEDLGAVLDKLSGLKAIALSGIHFHIGSQIT